MQQKELSALINLLDDSDSMVFNAVRDKLLGADEKIIPDLQTAVELSLDDLFIKRTVSIIKELSYKKLDDIFLEWLNNSKDLLFGSYIIAKYKYPNIIFEDIEDKLTKIINDIRAASNFCSLTPLQQIRRINHLIYNIQRFEGDLTNIFNPDNSYINKVLERRKANDVIIAIIYLYVSQKLDLPVFGVDFPGNFLLVFQDNNDEALFYINPINKGAVITENDIKSFLKNHKLRFDKKYFNSCNNKVIIKRLLRFLMHSYSKKNDANNFENIKRLNNLF